MLDGKDYNTIDSISFIAAYIDRVAKLYDNPFLKRTHTLYSSIVNQLLHSEAKFGAEKSAEISLSEAILQLETLSRILFGSLEILSVQVSYARFHYGKRFSVWEYQCTRCFRISKLQLLREDVS